VRTEVRTFFFRNRSGRIGAGTARPRVLLNSLGKAGTRPSPPLLGSRNQEGGPVLNPLFAGLAGLQPHCGLRIRPGRGSRPSNPRRPVKS
jgi:hypothetical protein